MHFIVFMIVSSLYKAYKGKNNDYRASKKSNKND
jgi:hypothetical protein